MSTIRDPAYITNAGRTMMTAGGDVTYTKAVLYGQDISGLSDSQIKALTSLGNPLREVKIGVSDKQSSDSGSTVILEAVFQNSDLKADLQYKAVGFFARKNDMEQLVIVAVANQGAYLAATNPDGVATDALDLKIAVKIGDATNVTAAVDPAGSVTPATLNGAINKATHDLTAKIDTKADKTDVTAQFATKADKTTVEQELAVKANSADVDKELTTKANASDVYTKKQVDDALSKKDDTADVDQKIATVNKSVSDLSDTVSANKTATDASLATKANASDVADNVKTLQANIDTKADKATVDAEIAKIDFTPYAKSADVAKDLQGYTTTADLTKLLAGKRDIADSYSRDELDKKFLQLSTDTSGKVSADQIAKLLASKVDKTDLTSQLQAITDSIGTKANSANVTAELAKKDNTADVDAKIKTVTDLANTKANASDVYNKQAIDTAFSQRDTKIGNNTNVINTINEALKSLIPDDTHAPALPAGFDLNNYFVGWRRSVNTTLKNMPFGWLNDTMYFQGTVAGSDGRFELALYIGDGPNTNPKIAYRFYGWGNWKPWVLLADNGDISNLQNQITNATNLANQASQKVDSTLANSFVRKQGMNANGDLVEIRGNATKQPDGGYDFDMYSSDWTASKLKDVLNALPDKASTTDVANANNNANGRLPLGGGNMTLRSTINWNGGGIDDRTGNLGGLQWAGGTDTVSIYGDQDDNDNLDLTFDLGDDGSNHFSFRNKGSEVAGIQSNGHYTGTVDWGNVWGRPDVTPIVNGAGGDDLFAFKSNQIRLYPGNGKICKNLPPASNTQWFTVQYVFENPNGDGVAIFRSPANEVWMVGNNGCSYTTGWTRLANSGDISNLQNIINQQNQTIQSLTTRLANAENEIRYIKANYVEGRTFPASQEAQANSWENENPQRIAFITK